MASTIRRPSAHTPSTTSTGTPTRFRPIGAFQARAWHCNRGLAQAGGELSLARALAVTGAGRTHPLRATCAERCLQLLFHDGLDHPSDPVAYLGFDGVRTPRKPV